MESSELAQHAMRPWSSATARRLLTERWTPTLLARLRVVVREGLQRHPDQAKHFGLVPSMRRVMEASADVQDALFADPALARWTAAMERSLAYKTPKFQTIQALLALCPRFAVATAIMDNTNLDVAVVMGAEGFGRIPAVGKLLEGEKARSTKITIRDGQLHSPARECARVGTIQVVGGDADGGMMPALHTLDTHKSWEVVGQLQPALDILHDTAPALGEELSILAPVIIPVAGAKHVSHSASLPDVRGCIWMSSAHDPWVLAETLIHEASHLKYYLAEDVRPFTTHQDEAGLVVPWREDPRPLSAVLMGLHAWIRVSEWLSTLGSGPFTEAAQQRLSIVMPALRQGLLVASQAPGLTTDGKALLTYLREAETHLDGSVG